MHYINYLINSISTFFATVGAKYAAYLERENVKARAEAKASSAAMVQQSMMAEYPFVADIIAQAANNIADVSTVRPVSDFTQVCTAQPLRVRRASNGGDYCGWCFRLRLAAGFTGTAAVLRRLLQTEAEAVTAARGVPRLFVDVVLGPDRMVAVWATPFADLEGGCR